MVRLAAYVGCGVLAYLIGAIPFGLLVARSRGTDIRRVGSGNIGATNVFRCVGKAWGILTLACDALKGFLPVFFLPLAAARLVEGVHPEALGVTCLALSVAGHNWPVYLKFKGGKGVATSAGALLGIAPLAVGIAVGVWILVVAVTRYVSVASIAAALGIAIAGWCLYLDRGFVIPVALTLLAAVATWRHKTNIGRLLKGTENKISFGKSNTKAEG